VESVEFRGEKKHQSEDIIVVKKKLSAGRGGGRGGFPGKLKSWSAFLLGGGEVARSGILDRLLRGSSKGESDSHCCYGKERGP